MSLLGQTIGHLASSTGGQLLLELPDDLPPDFVSALVNGANAEIGQTPPFCLLVHDRRKDLPEGVHSVDFRELAMYRQGSHLAVVFASDNRGMATYTSVYPLLLSPGFPSESSASGTSGIVSLQDLLKAIALKLAKALPHTAPPNELAEGFAAAFQFLTEAYLYGDNGQASVASDWWQHMSCWIESLAQTLPTVSENQLAATIYATAGLPVPSAGLRFAMRPRDYVEVLRARWSDASAIRKELLRLESSPTSACAASHLSQIEWEQETSTILLRTDSQIRRVALAGYLDNSGSRLSGWATLTEDDFGSNYVDAKGKLTVEVSDLPLPRPWAAAFPVLVVPETSAAGDEMRIEDVGIVVPWKEGPPGDFPAGAAQVQVRGLRGTTARFEATGQDPRPEGLLLHGCLVATPSAKAPSLLSLETVVSGEYSASLADRSDCMIAVVRATEVVLQVRRIGKTGAGPRNAFERWSDGAAPPQVKLGSPGMHELALAFGQDVARPSSDIAAGHIEFAEGWPGSVGDGLVIGRGDLPEDTSIFVKGTCAFNVSLSQESVRYLSPIAAAANGMLPDFAAPLEEVPLGVYDQEMLACLRMAETGDALGTFLTSTSREGGEFIDVGHRVHVQGRLTQSLQDLYPSIPSSALLESVEYRALLAAYRDLQLVEHIAGLEASALTSGVTPSRISLAFIPEAKIEAVLDSYLRLVHASAKSSRTDQFWAKHPFTVAVYPDGIGSQSLQAALLSPLHPLRLAWLWRVQLGLRAAYDDGADAAQALTLLDATLFPAACMLANEFDEQLTLMPVPIDAHPSDVYRGWHAFVRVIDSRLRIPHYINGDRFPVDGLSGLSPAAISAAIDDFLRVSPQVQALKLDLEAAEPIRRSSAIDDGILEKIEELAQLGTSLDGVGGIQVEDSPRRQGPIPSFQGISEALDLARGGFNASWSRRLEHSARQEIDGYATPHLTFLEGLPATLAIVASEGADGWIPKVPLRRFPSRRRPQSGGAALLYALGGIPADSFCASLQAFEAGPSGEPVEVRIKPNLAALPQRPNWLVAGDFGVDPQSIAAASAAHGAGRYMLWDWRPATTVRAGAHSASMRAQPYFIVASVPPALTSAIAARIQKLRSGLSSPDIEDRVRQLVQLLATRAVGLNTLLAVGHHQATGALGFYFALRSLLKWMEQSPEDEIRLVVPVDAVDPFLRSVASKQLSNRRRADLLAIRATVASDRVSVTMIPIEIKHYGLSSQEAAAAFPRQGEARLVDHVDQLRAYQEQLVGLSSSYAGATGGHASVIGQQLSAIFEAAIQLSPSEEIRAASALLSHVAGGDASLSVGKGLLMWYQAGASNAEGAKACLEETYGPVESRRIDVWIDPAAHDAEYWGALDGKLVAGGAHEVVLEALARAVDQGTTLSEEPEAPLSAGPSIDEEQAPTSSGIGEGSATGNASATTPPEDDIQQLAQTLTTVASNAEPRLAPQQLEAIYTRLLGALAEFNVSVQRPVNTTPYEEGPAFIEFGVRPAYGVSVSKIESQLENVKLRLGLPADATIGCANHLGNVLLTVPKNDRDRYFVTTSQMWSRWERPASGFHVPLGEDIKGQVVSLDLSSSNSPHLLIAGVTGSGKSEALLTLLHGAAHFYSTDELELRLIDPKQTELVSLEALSHCTKPAGWSAEDALDILSAAADEMDCRYELFRRNRVRDIEEYRSAVGPMVRTLIVLDEYADLTTDDDERKQIERQLKRLAQKARAAGIHVIVSTQKPVVQVINTVIKGNLPARIALRVNTGAESRVILDENGAEQLAGKGDALLKVGNSKVRLQFARYDGETDRA